MQEEWLKEKHALLKSIKEKEERLKDFEKVKCQQHFNPLPPQDDFQSCTAAALTREFVRHHKMTEVNSKFHVNSMIMHGREASFIPSQFIT